ARHGPASAQVLVFCHWLGTEYTPQENGPMAAHSIGSATISFGLVSVPIKMFSAGESSAAISFNWLHKQDGARLKQQYICSKDGEKVEKEDMIKGYEFSKGRYVQFTPDELKALEEKGTGSINITEFVDADTVDRIDRKS